MKGDDLPAEDPVVRYVKPSMIQDDGTPDGSDFRLRPNKPDEAGLSVNWLGAFDANKAHQLSEVRRLIRLEVKRAGRFAELNVGVVREIVLKELATLQIVHRPLDAEGHWEADPSHSEFVGLPPGDSDEAAKIGDMIAECVVAMHSAIDED